MRPLPPGRSLGLGRCLQCEGPSSASLFVAVVILVVSVMTSATLSVSVPAVAAHSARPSFAGSRCHVRPSKVDGVCCACRHWGLECGMHVLHGSRRDSQRSTLRPVCIQAPPRQGETSSAGAPSPRYRNERQSSQCAVEWASQATPRRINSAPWAASDAPSAQAPSHDADACTTRPPAETAKPATQLPELITRETIRGLEVRARALRPLRPACLCGRRRRRAPSCLLPPAAHPSALAPPAGRAGQRPVCRGAAAVQRQPHRAARRPVGCAATGAAAAAAAISPLPLCATSPVPPGSPPTPPAQRRACSR
jgi:hypothetical protein